MEGILETLTLLILVRLLNLSVPPVVKPWCVLTFHELDELHRIFACTAALPHRGVSASADGIHMVQDILMDVHDLPGLTRSRVCLEDTLARFLRRCQRQQLHTLENTRMFLVSRASRLQRSPDDVNDQAFSSLDLHGLHWMICGLAEMHECFD